jgi:pimeloyl-ACP methyl ester carboxylesterase
MSWQIVKRLVSGPGDDTFWLVGTGWGVTGSATNYSTKEPGLVVALTVLNADKTLNVLVKDLVAGTEVQVTRCVIVRRTRDPATADQFWLEGTGWGALSAATVYPTKEYALYWAEQLAEIDSFTLVKDQVNGIEYPLQPLAT